MSKSDLRIDWATHEATKYACENWHYSRCLPKNKLVKIGAWERGKFIGVVVFGYGATPNLGKPYNLTQDRCVELVRIALTKHESSVTRVAAFALKFLRESNPRLRLVVSYADPMQGHYGVIYQAGNWIYSGKTQSDVCYRDPSGKLWHRRRASRQVTNGKRLVTSDWKTEIQEGKHRYLMPLDAEMRERILPLAKPYPKRTKRQAAEHPSTLGGSTPTRALHLPASEAGDGSDQEHGCGATPTRTLQTSALRKVEA